MGTRAQKETDSVIPADVMRHTGSFVQLEHMLVPNEMSSMLASWVHVEDPPLHWPLEEQEDTESDCTPHWHSCCMVLQPYVLKSGFSSTGHVAQRT